VLAEVAVPAQVIVSMAEIAGAAKQGLLALAVGAGRQAMAAMTDDVARQCGPEGKHCTGRTG
jgi:putative transposase